VSGPIADRPAICCPYLVIRAGRRNLARARAGKKRPARGSPCQKLRTVLPRGCDGARGSPCSGFFGKRFQSDSGAVIFHGRTDAVDVNATVIVLLPSLRLPFRSGGFQIVVELPATGLPASYCEASSMPSFGRFMGALHHEIIARLGAKQTVHVERQDAVNEMADCGRDDPAVGSDLNRAIPLPPSQAAVNADGHRISQPKALAILSGRQR
jgi:hypothetical protein